jgi:signal peptidase I
MAALASNAPALVRQGPSPWITALLTVLAPGLGHVYIGQPRRGILLFALVMVADTLLVFAMMGVLARFWMFAVSMALLFALWLFIMIDAVARALHTHEPPKPGYNKLVMLAGAFAMAWLIFAGPCIYAYHAQLSGRLLWLNADTPSMEPTLRAGEFFLADASYYRSRKPSRGDVVVYVHPKEPGRQLIKRIVAVQGDRVAVKGGRAIVNGMAVEEPYVEIGPADTDLANLPESRVPAGHVFVLGDNRANSVDSRDALAHGPVPLENLIGRVTDIAISRHLARLGRWVGTPGHL